MTLSAANDDEAAKHKPAPIHAAIRFIPILLEKSAPLARRRGFGVIVQLALPPGKG
jgi:hypothetical protein